MARRDRPHTFRGGPGPFCRYGDSEMLADGVLPVPSRADVRADLEALAGDFGRLFATDCECHLRTDRHYWPSRFNGPSDLIPWNRSQGDASDWDQYLSGQGLEVDPVPVRSADDVARAPVFYDRAGRPVVDLAGQSMIMAPGWRDSHEIKLRGPGSLRAAETIERANDLALDVAGLLASILWPGRSLTFRVFGWPDVVDAVANRSTLKSADWYVMAGGQSYSLSVWRRRDEFRLGGPMVAPEVAERIGDDPENAWAVRRAFLRDSETVARWLIEALAEPAGDVIEADDRDAIESAALNAVVSGGLAGVLQVAAGARAVDRVTAIIRERVAGDRRLYWYRAEDWAAELKVSKPTVTASDGWDEIMKWRAANQAERVSKKTGK